MNTIHDINTENAPKYRPNKDYRFWLPHITFSPEATCDVIGRLKQTLHCHKEFIADYKSAVNRVMDEQEAINAIMELWVYALEAYPFHDNYYAMRIKLDTVDWLDVIDEVDTYETVMTKRVIGKVETDEEVEKEVDDDDDDEEEEKDKWMTVYNGKDCEGELFRPYCAKIGKYDRVRRGWYFQTFGGGPEGGYVSTKEGVYSISRSWGQTWQIKHLPDVLIELAHFGATGEQFKIKLKPKEHRHYYATFDRREHPLRPSKAEFEAYEHPVKYYKNKKTSEETEKKPKALNQMTPKELAYHNYILNYTINNPDA